MNTDTCLRVNKKALLLQHQRVGCRRERCARRLRYTWHVPRPLFLPGRHHFRVYPGCPKLTRCPRGQSSIARPCAHSLYIIYYCAWEGLSIQFLQYTVIWFSFLQCLIPPHSRSLNYWHIPSKMWCDLTNCGVAFLVSSILYPLSPAVRRCCGAASCL